MPSIPGGSKGSVFGGNGNPVYETICGGAGPILYFETTIIAGFYPVDKWKVQSRIFV